jgi:hypothetical protein
MDLDGDWFTKGLNSRIKQEDNAHVFCFYFIIYFHFTKKLLPKTHDMLIDISGSKLK